MKLLITALALCIVAIAIVSCSTGPKISEFVAWEKENPVRPLPTLPLGITSTYPELKEPPTPERVRPGRRLFYDKRLSLDGTLDPKIRRLKLSKKEVAQLVAMMKSLDGEGYIDTPPATFPQ